MEQETIQQDFSEDSLEVEQLRYFVQVQDVANARRAFVGLVDREATIGPDLLRAYQALERCS